MSSTTKERLTRTGMAMGTPAYMSPERGTGSGEVDGHSYVYSLGCVLYEMLVGGGGCFLQGPLRPSRIPADKLAAFGRRD